MVYGDCSAITTPLRIQLIFSCAYLHESELGDSLMPELNKVSVYTLQSTGVQARLVEIIVWN